MICNLNRNQCFAGPYYPIPMFNCGQRIYCLLNNSANPVINPTLTQGWAFLNATQSQVVNPGEDVKLTFASGSGSSITLENGGTIRLAVGTYHVSYDASGIVPANNVLSLTLFQDNTALPGTKSSVNADSGNSVHLVGSSVLTVTSDGTILRLINTNIQAETIQSANITITKVS